MSLSARREMIFVVNDAYCRASNSEKSKILDGFVATTGYERKYVILLLSKKIQLPPDERKRKVNSSIMSFLITVQVIKLLLHELEPIRKTTL